MWEGKGFREWELLYGETVWTGCKVGASPDTVAPEISPYQLSRATSPSPHINIIHDPGRAARTTDGIGTFSVALLQISYYRPPLQTDRQLGRHQKWGKGGMWQVKSKWGGMVTAASWAESRLMRVTLLIKFPKARATLPHLNQYSCLHGRASRNFPKLVLKAKQNLCTPAVHSMHALCTRF